MIALAIVVVLLALFVLHARLDRLAGPYGGEHGRGHLHHWRIAPGFEGAVHGHCVCRCGARKIFNGTLSGHSPIDRHWLETGEKLVPKPPPRPSDAGRSARPLR